MNKTAFHQSGRTKARRDGSIVFGQNGWRTGESRKNNFNLFLCKFVSQNSKGGITLKVKFFSLIIIACLCFGACSKQNAENIYSEKSMEQSSPSGSLSLDYDVQILSQETMDALSEDKFRWGGRGSSDLSVKWINQDELLFFLYQINESNEFCRIFSYLPSTDTLTLLDELSGSGAEGIAYFLRDDVSYLLWNHPYSPQLFQIGYGVSKVSPIEPFTGMPSPTGKLATVESESSAVILQDLVSSGEDSTQFHIEYPGEFIGWSPDGQYLTFYQSKHKQYTIYDQQGNLKQSIFADQLHWCEEPNFFTAYTLNNNEGSWKLFNIAEGKESVLPTYPEGDILMQEPGFALIRQSNIILLNHKTGECIPVAVSGFENSVLEFSDYDWETKTIALACWMETHLGDESVKQWPACYLIRLFGIA